MVPDRDQNKDRFFKKPGLEKDSPASTEPAPSPANTNRGAPSDAAIDALQRLKDEFHTGYQQHPDLYYAIIDGEAVKNGGVAFPQADGSYRELESYLKKHIADGKPCGESVGCKYPRYFFFGDDLAGVKQLTSIAQTANKIIRDGLQAVPQQAGSKDLNGGLLPEHWHLLGENLYTHEWMFWMMYLGGTSGNPVLTPKREKIQITQRPPNSLFRHADESLQYDLFLPTIHGMMGLPPTHMLPPPALNITPDQWTLALPPWKTILCAAKDGTLQRITIFDTSIFYASAEAVDELIKVARRGNPVTVSTTTRTSPNSRVFISYSHADKNWLDKLLKMLAPLVQDQMVEVWYDAKIKPSQEWRKEIENAMASARVAVLLVSDNFLSSEFISSEELPCFLKAAKMNQVKILWVALTPCMYEHTQLKDIQAVNKPSKPLNTFPTTAAQQTEIKNICKAIHDPCVPAKALDEA